MNITRYPYIQTLFYYLLDAFQSLVQQPDEQFLIPFHLNLFHSIVDVAFEEIQQNQEYSLILVCNLLKHYKLANATSLSMGGFLCPTS